MFNEILYELDAQNKLLNGATKLTKAVKSTLGPRGRNVIIENDNTQLITKDGVTVARSIKLEDKFENIGAKLVSEVAIRTNDIAGDGTTTAIVIAHALLSEGQKLINEEKCDPIALKEGMDKALLAVVDELKEMKVDISSFKEIAQVGTVSANNDKLIGKIIADAMEAVGKEGIITIEDSNNFETKLEIVDGVRISNGFISHYFATNQSRMETVFENPLIFITNKKISSMHEIVPLLENVAKLNKQLFIVAGDIDSEALSTLIINNVRGILKVCAIRAPFFGEKQSKILEDLASLTGGTFFDSDVQTDFSQIDPNTLGSARRIIVSKDSTTMIDGSGDSDVILERVNSLKEELQNTTASYDIETIHQRLANLTGGVAIIKVGAYTGTELREKASRIEDALNATRAAVQEGIVPGGGLALFKISEKIKVHDFLDKNIVNKNDFKKGFNLVIIACKAPFFQIIENAGHNPQEVKNRIIKNKNISFGFNSRTGEYIDLYTEGIIDPSKVKRCALENAVSVAGLLLTTNAIIVTRKNT